MMMASIIYLLCVFSSLACAVLLLRAYGRTRVPLLFWSGLCFVFLTVTNIALFLDLIVVKDFNLILFRRVPELVGIFLLIWGLIWKRN